MRRNQGRGQPGSAMWKRSGGNMAADNPAPGKSAPQDDVIVVSDEALHKAEAFIEAEEGAANRLMG